MVDKLPPRIDPERFVSDESERARAVADFLRDQEDRAQGAVRGGVRREHIRRIRRTTVIATWLGIAYVWVATPGWLTVQPPPPQPIEAESTSLRWNVFLQSQRIEAYRLERGRLPYVLDEAGPRFRGMEYRRRNSRMYELTGRSSRVELRYESEQAPHDFVGDAADLAQDIPNRGDGK